MIQGTSKIVVISNPLGGYNKRHGLDKIDNITELNNLLHIKASTPDKIIEALYSAAKKEPDILVINGGDGTVDIIVRQIRTLNIFKKEPVFLLLEGGTTNMIHREMKLKGSPDKVLQKVISGKVSNMMVRCPLKIEYMDLNNITPLYGFFLGTGAVARTVLKVQKHTHKKGFYGPLSELIILAALLFRLFVKRDISQDEILRPTSFIWNNEKKDHILLAVSTLKNLIPFVKSSATKDKAGTIYIGSNRKIKHGESSHISLKIEENWVLDGEVHDAGNLEITLGDPITFLTEDLSA